MLLFWNYSHKISDIFFSGIIGSSPCFVLVKIDFKLPKSCLYNLAAKCKYDENKKHNSHSIPCQINNKNLNFF